MPDNGILSSTHLPVSEVKRSRANSGVTLVGNPDWEGKVKHWKKNKTSGGEEKWAFGLRQLMTKLFSQRLHQ